MINPISKIRSDCFESVRDVSYENISEAIKMIHSLAPNFPGSHYSDEISFFQEFHKLEGPLESKELVSKIFSSVMLKVSDPKALEDWMQPFGIDSLTVFIRNGLDQELWDRCNCRASMAGSSLIALLNDEHPQDPITREEFEEKSRVIDARITEIEETIIDEQDRLRDWKSLKDRILEFPKAILFAKDDKERERQYLSLGQRFLRVFDVLSNEHTEIQALDRIPEFIDTCLTGWDSQIGQLEEGAHIGVTANTPFMIAQKIARDCRRSLVLEQALLNFLEEDPDEFMDPHVRNHAKQLCNDLFGLGYARDQLGPIEETLLDYFEFSRLAKKLIEDNGLDETLERLKISFNDLSSDKKERVIGELLDVYQENILKEERLLIDKFSDLSEVYSELDSWIKESKNNSESFTKLKNLINKLNDFGVIPSFSSHDQDVLILQKIQRYSLFTKALKDKTIEELLSVSEDLPGISRIRKIFEDKKQEVIDLVTFDSLDVSLKQSLEKEILQVESLLIDLENSQSSASKERYFIKLKEQVQSFISNFIYQRALLNRNLLEQKLVVDGELSVFGAYSWGAKSCILPLKGPPKTFPESVLKIFYQNPLSELDKNFIVDSVLARLDRDAFGFNSTESASLREACEKRNMQEIINWLYEIPQDPALEFQMSILSSKKLDRALLMIKNNLVSDFLVKEAFLHGVEYGQLEIVKKFLDAGVVSAKNIQEGFSLALDEGAEDLISILLGTGDVSQKMIREILASVIQTHEITALKTLIKSRVLSNEDKQNALGSAIRQNFVEGLRCLLNALDESDPHDLDLAFLSALKLNFSELVPVFFETHKVSERGRSAAISSIIEQSEEIEIEGSLERINLLIGENSELRGLTVIKAYDSAKALVEPLLEGQKLLVSDLNILISNAIEGGDFDFAERLLNENEQTLKQWSAPILDLLKVALREKGFSEFLTRRHVLLLSTMQDPA